MQQLRKKNSNVYSIGIEDLNLLNYGDILNFLKENNIKKIIHLGWSMNNENSAIYDNIEAMSNLIKSCEEVQIEKFIFASTNNVYGTKIKNVPFLEEDRLSPDINNKYGISKYIEALNNLLKASEEVQVEKIIFTSTNNVYGTELNGNSFSEEDKTNLDENNKYGISKYLGEELVKYSMYEKACIIRIADVYGPGQNHGNLIKAIISNVENKENIKLYGKGERERDYIYIDDVIRGIEFIYENNSFLFFNKISISAVPKLLKGEEIKLNSANSFS